MNWLWLATIILLALTIELYRRNANHNQTAYTCNQCGKTIPVKLSVKQLHDSMTDLTLNIPDGTRKTIWEHIDGHKEDK